MKKDDHKPATKKDLRELGAANKKDLRNLEIATKKDIHQLRREMATKKDLKKFKNEIVHEFKIIAENLQHDYEGIFKDRTEQHGDRIRCLEEYTGLRLATAS